MFDPILRLHFVLHLRQPLFHFVDPIVHHPGRGHHQDGPLLVVLTAKTAMTSEEAMTLEEHV